MTEVFWYFHKHTFPRVEIMKLPCPYCTENIVYDQNLAGKTIKCSYCQKNILMTPLDKLPQEYQQKYKDEREGIRKKQESEQRKLEDQRRRKLELEEAKKDNVKYKKFLKWPEKKKKRHINEFRNKTWMLLEFNVLPQAYAIRCHPVFIMPELATGYSPAHRHLSQTGSRPDFRCRSRRH